MAGFYERVQFNMDQLFLQIRSLAVMDGLKWTVGPRRRYALYSPSLKHTVFGLLGATPLTLHIIISILLVT